MIIMKKGVRYKKPPLVEALCEFRFQRTVTVPNIVLGKLYERIEKDFPTVETHRGFGVQAGKENLSPSIVMEERTRFISNDRTKLIQVGEGFLAANQLKPYKDYPSFRAFVKEVIDTYHEVAKPEGLQSIGLRYINRVEMKPDQSPDEVFNIGFTIPSNFQSSPDPFLLRMDFMYSTERDRLIVILATAQMQENSQKAITLDFDYRLVKPEEINGNLLEWMDEAHEKIEDAFHACLKESILYGYELEGE
jgi:uncharacterized protein (TIGR04255 family)